MILYMSYIHFDLHVTRLIIFLSGLPIACKKEDNIKSKMISL
jgi:hypothetical protein